MLVTGTGTSLVCVWCGTGFARRDANILILSPAYLQPFVFNCDIHIHLCDSMNCPCVCINYLIAHYWKNNFEATFQHLPFHVRDELKNNLTFCQNLFHSVFNIANGQQIINER